jgi:hypothetical protein
MRFHRETFQKSDTGPCTNQENPTLDTSRSTIRIVRMEGGLIHLRCTAQPQFRIILNV